MPRELFLTPELGEIMYRFGLKVEKNIPRIVFSTSIQTGLEVNYIQLGNFTQNIILAYLRRKKH